MKYLLQRIIFPEIKDSSYAELFLRSSKIRCNGFDKINDILSKLEFNTWMNLFAAKKWFHYTEVRDLYLGIDIQGTFSIEVIGSNRNSAYDKIEERVICKEFVDNKDCIYLKVDNAGKYDAVYLILKYPKNRPCKITSIGWYTETNPCRKNRLAIVTCTYKREDYIANTIKMFESYLEENQDLSDRMHLFVVDNGKTLDESSSYKYTHVYHNMNAGGAGGFGRGLIEACKSDKEYTRCLFMDDDVEIMPESFYRTLVLSDYLKDKYKNALINGAMLDLYNKKKFVENLAVQDGLWVHPYHGEANLYDYDAVLNVNNIPEDIFYNEYPKTNGAWFYCSFSMDKYKTIDNLPLPIFIRGDDVEYGYRHHGEVFIQLNGICIWHAPFYYRVNKVTDSYFLCRNMFIVNVLYTDGFENIYQKLYRERFNYAIDTYDYISAKLIIEAQKDILKGLRLFEENPETIMKRVNEIAKEDTTPVSNPYELLEIKNKKLVWKSYRRLINKCIRKIYKYIPYSKCLVKRNGMNMAPEWFPPMDLFLVKKQVKVYNLLKETSIVRKFDYKLERELVHEFEKNLKKINSSYGVLKDDYKSGFKKITSYEFWKKYLDL